MPGKKALEKARKAKAEGQSPSAPVGELLVSSEQAMAIALAKARRSGIRVPRPKRRRRRAVTMRALKRRRRAVSRASLAKHPRTSAKDRSPRGKAARTRKHRRARRGT
jgi:hypothetical protein